MANKTEEQKQESNAQEAVDVSQSLEMTLLLLLLGEIKSTLEKPENKSQSISNIRKGTEKEVNKYLPLLLASAGSVLSNNYKQIAEGLKGTAPKYTNTALKDTEKYFKKYIKSKGTNFVVGKGKKLPQYFTTFIEKEVQGVVDGTISMNDAIKKAIKELSDNGVSIIEYESGVKRNIDVFVRQQMLYAQRQSANEIREKYAEENGITIWEFDAHPNARPSHQKWQGKRFDTTGKYYPTKKQLNNDEDEDYGCKHIKYPVPDKDDPYMFTKEQLSNINTKPFEFNGKTYTGYEATQKQRLYERQIRALKREKKLNDEMGIVDETLEYRLKNKKKEYSQFCKAFGTYERIDRTTVYNK